MNKSQARRRSARQPISPPKKNRRVRLDARWIEELRYFCKMLNRLQGKETQDIRSYYPSPEEKANREDMERTEWKPALEIIANLCARPVPKGSRRHFNSSCVLFEVHYGRHALGRLRIRGGDTLECSVEGPQAYGSSNYKQYVAFKLWDVIFRRKGYERVRECLQCEKWFVDMSDNKKTLYCPGSCRNAYWTRSRRREAGHKSQPKKRNARKKGVRS